VGDGGNDTQRPIIDDPCNDIPSLAVEHSPNVMGCGRGWKVDAEAELDSAMRGAIASNEVGLIRVMLAKDARSRVFTRLGAALAAQTYGSIWQRKLVGPLDSL